MHRQQRVLQGQTDADTEDRLITVQVGFRIRSVVVDRVHETRAEGDEAGSSDDDVLEPTDFRDDSRREDEEEDLYEDKREESDTRACRRGMVDGLVRLGKVVDDSGESCENAERDDGGGPGRCQRVYWEMIRHSRDRASFEESELEHGMLSKPVFVTDEDEGKDGGHDDSRNYAPVRPLLGDAAPLHEKDEADCPADRNRHTEPVALGDLLDHRLRVAFVNGSTAERWSGRLREKHECESNATCNEY